MHISFAVFADAANLSQEGKLNILGVFDAVVIGLGAMIGAGIFAALTPAAPPSSFRRESLPCPNLIVSRA